MYNRIIQTFLDCAEHVGVPLAAWCRRMSPPKGGDPGAVRAVGCGVGSASGAACRPYSHNNQH